MAAVFVRQNGFINSRFNGVILLRSLLSRQYHATILNTEPRSDPGLLLKRFTSGEKHFRRWSSDDPKPPVHNVNLVFSRGPLRWLANKMKLFLVRSYFDSDFDEVKFLEGAKQAVCTVSSLASQHKFNELEGLLTNEAIERLRDEVIQKDADGYEINMEDILQAAIYDIGFQYDDIVLEKNVPRE